MSVELNKIFCMIDICLNNTEYKKAKERINLLKPTIINYYNEIDKLDTLIEGNKKMIH